MFEKIKCLRISSKITMIKTCTFKLIFLMKFIFRKIQMIWIDLTDPLPHLQVDLPLDMEVLSN